MIQPVKKALFIVFFCMTCMGNAKQFMGSTLLKLENKLDRNLTVNAVKKAINSTPLIVTLSAGGMVGLSEYTQADIYDISVGTMFGARMKIKKNSTVKQGDDITNLNIDFLKLEFEANSSCENIWNSYEPAIFINGYKHPGVRTTNPTVEYVTVNRDGKDYVNFTVTCYIFQEQQSQQDSVGSGINQQRGNAIRQFFNIK